MAINVLGTELTDCSTEPLTGFYRDGCCNTGVDDHGVHTVCVITTEEFLNFSKAAGMTFLPQEMDFRDLIRATTGAFVLLGGRKLMKLDALHK